MPSCRTYGTPREDAGGRAVRRGGSGAGHPLDPDERIKGPELGRPVTIGSKVWIGGGSISCPGVTIGEGSTIGAGGVVVKDIPPTSSPRATPAASPGTCVERLLSPLNTQDT